MRPYHLIISLLLIATNFNSYGMTPGHQKMIDLAKAYKSYMFRNHASTDDIKALRNNMSDSLATASEFIIQCITEDNKLLNEEYLKRPGNKVLKQIYIVREINKNLREEVQVNNERLIDSLQIKEISSYELLDNYYNMLFTGVGNKIQPFNFSRVNFKLDQYNLQDETEKAILFLRCMDHCGRVIWGYMNIVKPANTQKALKEIHKFPKFNGKPYFQYSDFYFNDFLMKILDDQDIQSYKKYFLDKYYEVLIYHLICLNQEGKSEQDRHDLLLGSILKEKNLYKFSKHKETLDKLFKEVKME